MNISKKIGKFVKDNKIELRALFCLVIALLLAISIEIFTTTYSRVVNTASTSRIEGNTAYIDDLTADSNYLEGLNYTEIRSTSIPSGASTGYYDDANLVRVELTYDGRDYNNSNLVGAVSPINNENVNKYVYYKYYPLERNSNGTLATDSNNHNYIHIELIDNPFSKRPYVNSVEYGFNGWVCNPDSSTTSGLCNSISFKYSKADYTRYMDVPVTGGSQIKVHLNASWIPADVVTTAGDISDFNSMTMVPAPSHIETETITHYYNYRWKNNYTTMEFQRTYVNSDGNMPNGYYYKTSESSTTYTRIRNSNTKCPTSWFSTTTCYVYEPNTAGITANSIYDGSSIHIFPSFNNNNTVYATNITGYNATYMNKVEEAGGSITETETINNNVSDLEEGTTVGGYYYKVSNPTAAMLNTKEYYTSNGTLCTSTSSCTTAYKLIQYEDVRTNTDGTSIYYIHKGNDNLVIDQDNYYYLVTRDLNIFRYTSTTRLNMSNFEVNRPFTVTGTAINGTTTSGVLSLNGYDFTAANDIVIENIKIYGPNTSGTENIAAGNDSKTNNVIYANSHNLKIGRNVTSSRADNYLVAESILSGTTSALSGTFKVIVESGKYYSYHSGTMNGSSNYTFNQTTILGNDYDRIIPENKSKLKFLIGLDGYTGGRYTAGSDSLFASYTVFKSGLYGYNDDGTPNNDTTAGMYIGGYNGLIVNSLTGVKIEGGDISYATGGYGYNGGETTNATYIGMSGGTIRSIYGGAGYSTTKGNRIINVTGGTVSYSILGGSDSFSSSSTTDGVVNGDTLIYVGGTAYVGGGTDTVQGVEAGSVFGAGGGNTSSTQKGTVSNSHIIINGGTIANSVYGGGNYGSTGTQSSSAATTKIDIYAGTIGNVFGGSKSAGFSKSNYAGTSTIDINVMGGTIGNVYGGSNTKGDVYGSIDIDITGGNITNNVYGGGQGSQTVVSNNIDITIGTQGGGSTTPTIGGSVYGGSALGTVNGAAGCTTVSSSNTHVIVNSGTNANIFGGGQGDANDSAIPRVCGNVTVDINGGTNTNIYGGNDLKGTPNGRVTVSINGGTNTSAYAGGNQTTVTEPYINVTGGTTTNAFGGGNNATVTTSHITVSGGTVTNAYGGGNNAGVTTSNMSLTGGTVTNAYGGGNNAGVTTTNVTLNGSSCTKVFGGSNASGNVTTSNVTCTSGSATSVYGGNNQGGTTATTNVIVNGGTITNAFGGGEKTNVTTKANVTINGNTSYVYGGSNTSGTVTETNVRLNGSATDVYGGNNLGGTSTTTLVTVAGNATNVYGGGNQATTTTSTINYNSGTVTNVYGGGNQAGVTTTNVNLGSGSITNVFGGSNTSGNVTTTNVTTVTSASNLTVSNVFGGNNQGGTTTTSHVTLSRGTINNVYGGGERAGTNATNVTINGATINQTVFGGGDNAQVTTDTSVNITNNSRIIGNVFGGGNNGAVLGNTVVNTNSSTIDSNVYGGGNQADVEGTTTVTIANNSLIKQSVFGGGNVGEVDSETTVEINNSTVKQNVYGGGNQATVNDDTNVTINNSTTIEGNVYGGGNAGEVEGITNVEVNNATVEQNVYGGGNLASANDDTNVIINNSAAIEGNVYGGGNAAAVEASTNVTVDSATIEGNIFGGGNNGMVFEGTIVKVKNATILESVYAGGNGATAIVMGDTLLNIEGTTSVTHHVFGGGNAAATGCAQDIEDIGGNVIAICTNPSNSSSEVNIAGATIGGNVYGGANTSVLYGETTVNIGKDVTPQAYNLTKGNITINGTVFGGGEANASGSEDYDYSFISVTKGININIDANGHNTYLINGSIFGSGNASSSGGYSYIYIKNYGNSTNYKSNISIQRTDIVTLDNSAIKLSGATDRTNKYKAELFTFSRIGELKLKNNSTVYLEKGANLLESLSSLKDQNNSEVYETVTINENTGVVTKNVDNRVYMIEGKNLNISDDESLGSYGDVNGMAFFGMFTLDRNGNVATAMYSPQYDSGDEVPSSELYYFSSGSYVVGKHKSNHDYYVDGFYTNYVNEDGETIKTDYIIPTPDNATFYRWVVGEQVDNIEFTLTASKYSTLGTYELQLLDYYEPNTEIDIIGVNFDGLNSNINLLQSHQIPRHAASTTDANKNFGLQMETGTTAWITEGNTQFLTTGSRDIVGTTIYKSENSNAIPSFIFYLHHSKNLDITQDLGFVTISLMIVTPINDLSNKIQRINIVANLKTVLYEGDYYEATITPGPKYQMFANNAVNITNRSTFSAYYSLYSASATTIYQTGDYRTLVSSYALPENTKITMIDLATSGNPDYYYYVINQADYNASIQELQTQGEISYKLSKFIKMDSSSPGNIYNDAAANNRYYDSVNHVAEEEFIFIIDLKDTNLNADVIDQSLLFELRKPSTSKIMPVLDVEQVRMRYNLYNNKGGIINLNASLSNTNLYIGKSTNLNVITDFAQQQINDTKIIDTNFYDQKLGIKITILDSNNNIVNGVSLLGLNYEYNGVTYYPRVDGTTRFNIAERVANVSSRIKINAQNANIATGNYKIKIDTFGSSDGIYYGLESSRQEILNIRIVNEIYGLEVDLADNDVLIDYKTGKSQDGDNNLRFNVKYSSGLTSPTIRLAVLRRTYDSVFNYTYTLFDYTEIFSTELQSSGNQHEYIVAPIPNSENLLTLTTKDNLKTGTYRLEFRLYDYDTYIGSAYRDIIIE